MAKKEYSYRIKINDTTPDWHLSRRKFMGSLLTGAMVTALPTIANSSLSNQKVLSDKQLAIVSSVQQIMFPSDNNGPGAYDILADKYLLWVLSDERMDPEEKEYILYGIGWVEETANEEYSSSYSSLSEEQKKDLISLISKENWGNSWLSVILSFIFEALLCDPQYGGNPDGIGWQWLDHNAGFPRPTKQLLYPEIINTIAHRKANEK